MLRTTFWLAAALSSVPAEGGRGLRGVRTRRAETPDAPDMWYSVEYEAGKRYCRYDAHYPPQFLDGSTPGMLFDDRDGCCAAYPGACPDVEATITDEEEDLVLSSVDPTSVTMPTPEVFGDVTTAAATTTTAAPLVPRWYPVDLSGHRTCVYDAEYNPAYLTSFATFLFDGRDECCDAFQACQTSGPTPSPTGRPARWFPHTFEDGRHACVHGSFYPDEMAEETFSNTFLHDTEEACCEGFPSACRHDDVWRWIPNHSGDDCAHVELPPSMLREDHGWIFNTREACCEEHPCVPGEEEEDKTATTTEAPATTTEEPVFITDPTELTTEAPETTTMVTTTEAPETTTTKVATTTAADNVHCAMGYDPVCGHDGLAYGSGCDAVAFGTGIGCQLDARLDIAAGSPCTCPDSKDSRSAEGGTKEPMWYSVEYEAGKRYCRYDAHYPSQFLTVMSRGVDGYLFETRDGCCAYYPEACPTTTAAPPTMTTTTTTTTTAAPSPMWYPVETKKGRKCRYNAEYDPDFLTAHATFLFETEDECCEAFPEACKTSPPIVMPTTLAPTARPTGFPTSSPTPATAGRWLSNQDGSDCVNMDLPWNMATSGLAYETRDECCAANSCPGGDADTTTEAPGTTTESPITTEVPITTTAMTTATETPVTTSAATATAAEQPPMWYPIETDGGSTSCVRDSSYPPSYHSGFLFETREGCCGAFPAACVTRAPTAQPTTAQPTARLTGFPTEQPTPETAGRWLSNQDGSDCVYMDLPWSMANSDLAFETRDGCCAANACPGESADTTTEAPATTTEAPGTTTEETTTVAPMTTTEATTTTVTTTEAATVAPTEEPGLAYPGCFWHFDISPGQQGKCTNSDLPQGVFEAWSGNPMYMFDTADECCKTKFNPDTGCPLGINDVGCTYASETTTTAAPEVTEPTEVPGADWPGCKWHMDLSAGAYMGCTNSDEFPLAWEGNPGQMFDTAAACCDKWYGGSCNTVKDVGCSYASGGDGETGTTSTEAPAEPGCMWHMSTSVSGKVCSNDQVYPPSWDDNKSQWFFSTSTECCEVRGGCDQVIDDCPGPNAPAEPEDPAEPGCMWHMSTSVSGKVCSNDQVYPPSWNDNKSQWFFSTSTECCEVRGGCDQVIDDCPGPNAPAEPEDPSYMKIPGPRTIIDFEGGAMAYIDILAESPGWTMSSDHAYAGDSSMTNAVDDESWGTQSDLVLKVDLANPSTVTFWAMIDVGMGYEKFALFVDGQQRNTYGQRITDRDGEPTWLPVTTSLPPGRHVLSMSVMKAPERPESWPRDLKSEGSGSVWVDEIEIFDTL